MKRAKKTAEFVQWMGPVLDALRAVGGSARPKEVVSWIASKLSVPAEVQEATLKSGGSRFQNQVHWARQYLVWEGLIDDTRFGIWALTPLGWKAHLDEESARAVFLNRVKTARADAESQAAAPEIDQQDSLVEDEKREVTLLQVLQSLPSYGFELICERLLREHGFEEVSVTARSRDGGIDGFGTLRLSPFVSMRVAFQSKRYKGAVGRPEVGQFRNDFQGRAEKGVLITTGRFTPDAQSEASAPGKSPIELVDGERIVELFEERGLGVTRRVRYEVDFSFFDQFRLEKS